MRKNSQLEGVDYFRELRKHSGSFALFLKMVIRALNVAEKPSAAKEITTVLSSGQGYRSRSGRSRYNPIYEFGLTIQNTPVNMTFTSVTGHLKGSDFESRFQTWGSCDPIALLDPKVTRVEWSVAEDKKYLAETLKDETRRSDWIILWLDCDSEGEKIAFDVADVCKQAKPNVVVKRARFSAMTRGDLFRAVNQLTTLNEVVANMVATRQEIDLRAGSAYTRFLTKQLEKFSLSAGDKQLISYGPCQFPTLGLVVDRWLRIENFVRRPFWVFDLTLRGCNVPLEWSRKHLFDEYSAMVLYEFCVEQAQEQGNVATVMRVDKRQKSKWRPLPLSTVEMQKAASRLLRMSSHRTMQVAEALYNKGFISYPRTETDQFGSSYNLQELVQKQVGHSTWGQFASRLLTPASDNDAVTFIWPRRGQNDDGAHPPIHPTDSAPENFEQPDHRRLYEYITKRFLACCSIDAKGAETRTEVRVGNHEFFSAKGLVVQEKGYLEVMEPFERWSDKEMPPALLQPQAQIQFDSFIIRQSQTQPPPLLLESDLIALMDRHGIGTDATIAEHIRKVLDREYVEQLHGGRFSPTEIGKALVIAHEKCHLQLARPHMRAKQEQELKRILTGEMQPVQVLHNALSEYTTKFSHLRDRRSVIDAVFQASFTTQTAQSWTVVFASFSRCGICGQNMSLKANIRDNRAPQQQRGRGHGRGRGRGQSRGRGGSRGEMTRSEGVDRGVHCATCDNMLKLPRNGNMTAGEQNCPLCNYQVVVITNTTSNTTHTVCPHCMSNPPTDREHNPQSKTSEFRCFHCTNDACSLAKGTRTSQSDVAKCPKCNSACAVRSAQEGSTWLVSCTAGRNVCDWVYFFPRHTVQDLNGGEQCPTCGSKKLQINWRASSLPHGAPSTYFGCIWCSPDYADTLQAMGEGGNIPRPPHPANRSFPDVEGSGRGNNRGGRGRRGQGRGRGRGFGRAVRYRRGNR